MSSNILPFEFNSNGKGSNTRIDYYFRDGEIIVRDTIVLLGKLTQEEITELAAGMTDGKFLPSKVGLPDLLTKMPASWEENVGDAYHVIERISFTPREQDDFAPTTDQFLAMADKDYPTHWESETSPSL